MREGGGVPFGVVNKAGWCAIDILEGRISTGLGNAEVLFDLLYKCSGVVEVLEVAEVSHDNCEVASCATYLRVTSCAPCVKVALHDFRTQLEEPVRDAPNELTRY